MAHAGVKDEAPAWPVETGGVLGETRGETVVERQDLAGSRLRPPHFDHGGEPFGIGLGQIVGLREIGVEIEELPPVVIERQPRRVISDGFPAALP